MTANLKQVLVHLDGSGGVASRMQVARQIGTEHAACVTALFAVTPAFMRAPYAGEAGPALADAFAQFDAERRKRVRAEFDAAASAPGAAAEWAEVRDFPVAGAFCQQALHADLVVLGQHEAGSARIEGLPGDFVESVVMGSGKPVIVVPYTGWSKPVGRTVVIAWKDSRESARAVAAALPLLQRANQVHVLSWSEEPPVEIVGRRLGLSSWLHLHDIDAEFHHEAATTQAPGDLLLSRTFELQADLLVMGCYGHSRAREMVLGGVTRTVLRSMTLPVLMAH